MSNTRNMNQANNFWDFVASLQNNQGEPIFAEGRGPTAEFDPFQGQEFWGPWANRGRRHGPPGPHGGHGHRHGRDGHRGPPPPPGPPAPPQHDDVPAPPPPPFNEPLSRSPTPPTPPETPAEPHHHPRPESPRHRRGPSPHHGPHHHGGPPHHRRGPSPHHHRGPSPHHHRGRGGRGGRGGHHNHPRGGPNPAFPFDLSALAEAFAPALFGGNAFGGNAFGGPSADTATREHKANANNNDGTFTPSVDLFSTPTSYILHASLPGAKKPEIDVTYSATRNSLTISGVVTRPDVSEDMMNCLVTDERREVGMFEREVRLEEGVKIDEEKIGAKLEDGVLRVIVPKILQEEEEGWESVRKVELE
ncbi:hypothetical protein AUEXF2481DRAFT_37938 [Aureobasidium subglaciale EXF-2481]|uniref:SHSP domain-containing protein n=1 Tax=Aureobasidium subglaciale (strain EXF-2481) TaxID=1043005 RepID=A0A074YMT4_AURSE|nr:uncharacterized protein AUEXF2481DRAFT_37938 [Aureobasidium subglaciale EXF-2481]KEQ97419.1 hypothetical protein AUEXF2481DRAFT_37938 [Aureobasidium subglaciale EXF-2481]